MDVKRTYETPRISVYDVNDIVDLLGPAQAASASDASGEIGLPVSKSKPSSRSGSTFGR